MSNVITIDDLNTYMVGKTLDPDLAQQIVDQANSWVDTRTGRLFGETAQVTERYDYGSTIWLRHMDVQSVDSIELGWPGQTQSPVDPAAYYLNELGRVTLFAPAGATFPQYHDYMAIKYTYGVLDVPSDLMVALLGIAAGFYTWAENGQRDIASVSVGSYNVAYTNKRSSMGGTADDATSTSDANWAVIDAYRLRRQ